MQPRPKALVTIITSALACFLAVAGHKMMRARVDTPDPGFGTALVERVGAVFLSVAAWPAAILDRFRILPLPDQSEFGLMALAATGWAACGLMLGHMLEVRSRGARTLIGPSLALLLCFAASPALYFVWWRISPYLLSDWTIPILSTVLAPLMVLAINALYDRKAPSPS